jgi:prepilin-type N-terminal cleavage/methylation domain-containing protein
MSAPTRARRGFTLVEAIAAMAVIGLLGSLSAALLFRAGESYRTAAVGAQLHAELAAALDAAERTIRSIPANPGGAGPDIVQVTPTLITWNGSQGTGRLELSADQVLLSTDGEPAAPILTDASALDIRCFDEAGSALAANLSGAAAEPVRRVEVTITVQRAGITETLRTRVFIRSMASGAAP